MRIVLRGVFFVLMILAWTTQAVHFHTETSVTQGADPSVGFDSLGLRRVQSTMADVVAVEAPGCAEPLMVTHIHFDGFGQSTARALMELGTQPRFVYLGFVGEYASPVSIVSRWAVASLLQALGMRRDDVPHEVLLVTLPVACPGLTQMDWSELSPWRRAR